MKKIISFLLIYCILIQIPLTQIGCTTFYPTEENSDLSSYSNYDGRILLMLKDKTKLYTTPEKSFFIDKPSEYIYGIGGEYDYKNKNSMDFKGFIDINKIDSTKLWKPNSNNNYQVYWMKDNRKLTIETKNLFTITPESGSNFWLVLDYNNDEMRKIYNSDIEEIQVQKTNWVTTSFLILGVVVGLVIIAVVSTFELDGSGGW